MNALARSVLFFFVAGLMEIGGGYLMWLWLRERRAWGSGALGALVLVGYESCRRSSPPTSGASTRLRQVSVAMAMLWGWLMDGRRPDRWDIVGAAPCAAGVAVIIVLPTWECPPGRVKTRCVSSY